jgi:hypothetical protein
LGEFFFPVARLPVELRLLSNILPLTYDWDALHGAINDGNILPYALDFSARAVFCSLPGQGKNNEDSPGSIKKEDRI